MATIQFDNSISLGKRAIVVSFDLRGFSTFCNHPEAYAILPKFISVVFEELSSVFISPFREFWDGVNLESGLAPEPDFIKYTGDGAVMIWFPPEDLERKKIYCTAIVSAMRRFQHRLAEIVPKLEIEWQINRLPYPARFGIAAGLVYPLKENSIAPDLAPAIDYAGYPINLAVRLQDHCPEVGFLIHELVFPQLDDLVKYIAHGMKGVQSEPVLMFQSDFPAMTVEYIQSKFQPCGLESALRCQASQREFGMANGKLSQPRFEVRLVDGPWNGMYLHLPEAAPFFYPVWEKKDAQGKVLERKRLDYQRVSEGPPIIYRFVRSENIELQ